VGSTIFNSEIAFRIGAEILNQRIVLAFFWLLFYKNSYFCMESSPDGSEILLLVFTTTDTDIRISSILFIIRFVHDFHDTSSDH
jgi:hypothetical protein